MKIYKLYHKDKAAYVGSRGSSTHTTTYTKKNYAIKAAKGFNGEVEVHSWTLNSPDNIYEVV